MRAPYTQLYLHVVWATWDRLPFVTASLEQDTYAAIRAKCDELKCLCLAIGGMPDHVHLLVRLNPAVSVADVVKGVKGSSSHLATHMIEPAEFFKWQGGYGAFTLARADVPAVVAYIERQKEHHAVGNLQEEWEQTQLEKSDD
jgi:REP-associated tyrosine transposase